MFPDRTGYPRSFDEFAKQTDLNFPAAKRSVYTAVLNKFVKCVKEMGKKRSIESMGYCSPYIHFPDQEDEIACYLRYFDILTHLTLKGKPETLREIWMGDEIVFKPDHIAIDKSPEGAWEAVLLAELGDQFDDTPPCIVTSWRKFYSCRPGGVVSGRSVCAEVDMKTLSTWDITPKVDINDDETATVYYCIFDIWEGFRQVSRRIHFDTGELEEPVTLEKVPYNCGIIY